MTDRITSVAGLRKAVQSKKDRMIERLLFSFLVGFFAVLSVTSFTWMIFQNLLSLLILVASMSGLMVTLALIIRERGRKWVLGEGGVTGGC